MVAGHGDARRMNLRVARIREKRAALIGAPRGRDIAVLRVGGQEKDIAVTARRQHNGIRGVRRQPACDEIAQVNKKKPGPKARSQL